MEVLVEGASEWRIRYLISVYLAFEDHSLFERVLHHCDVVERLVYERY